MGIRSRGLYGGHWAAMAADGSMEIWQRSFSPVAGGAVELQSPWRGHHRVPRACKRWLPRGKGPGTPLSCTAEGAPAQSPVQGAPGFGSGLSNWVFTAVLFPQPGWVPQLIFFGVHKIPQTCCSASRPDRPVSRESALGSVLGLSTVLGRWGMFSI